MILAVQPGGNQFWPCLPLRPYFRKELHYRFRLSQEWWDDELTFPVGFGCKWAIGKYNYHEGGVGVAISYDQGKVYLHPRYYESIQSGTYKLHELTSQRVELHKGGHDGLIRSNGLLWALDGVVLAEVDTMVPHGWLAMPYIGRSGRDNRYGIGDIPKAFAQRKLRMEFKIL